MIRIRTAGPTRLGGMGTAGTTSTCQAWVITGSGLLESWWWSSSSTKSCSPTASAQETSSRASQSLRVQEGHMRFAFFVPGCSPL